MIVVEILVTVDSLGENVNHRSGDSGNYETDDKGCGGIWRCNDNSSDDADTNGANSDDSLVMLLMAVADDGS